MSEVIEGQEQGQQINPAEEKAKAQGWVEKEQFKGDPDKWVDAETFIKRGQEALPILKERNEHLVKEIQEMKKTFKDFADFASKTEERAYNKALREIEAKKQQALQDEDVNAYHAADKEATELVKERPVPPKVDEPKGEDPLFTAFKSRNKWYESDPELTAEADALGAGYAQQGKPYAEILSKVEDRMKKLYPEKFGNSRRDETGAVEFSPDTGLPKKAKSKTYDNLPPDAKAACDRFIARGLITKEQYVANYEWEG
jgi:hypothetical protein